MAWLLRSVVDFLNDYVGETEKGESFQDFLIALGKDIKDLGKDIGPLVTLLMLGFYILRQIQLKEHVQWYLIFVILYSFKILWWLMILATYLCIVSIINEPLYRLSICASFFVLLAVVIKLCVDCIMFYYKNRVIPDKTKVKTMKRLRKSVVDFFQGFRNRKDDTRPNFFQRLRERLSPKKDNEKTHNMDNKGKGEKQKVK